MSLDLVVLGLGYVGLPLARRACAAGLTVAGIDVDEKIIAGLQTGRSHLEAISDEDVGIMLARGFTAQAAPSIITDAEVVILCVPTGLIDGDPDLRAVVRAAETVATYLRPGSLVVLESTSYPGTTEEVVQPALESTGLTCGIDFNLGYSPERIDPGSVSHTLENTPKIVSGSTPVCAKRTAAFYELIVDTVVVATGIREAETAKLLENAYRAINIALVNETAMLCHQLDIDIWEVLRCAATKPFGFQAFTPGPGVGGHCIAVDPVYLAHKARAAGLPCSLITAAHAVNTGMPGYVVHRAHELLVRHGERAKGARVLLLGVTYKPDVDDLRNSPAYAIVRGLRTLGAEVTYHDPHAPAFIVDNQPVDAPPTLTGGLERADLTILLQPHSCFDLSSVTRLAALVLDTQGRMTGDRVIRL